MTCAGACHKYRALIYVASTAAMLTAPHTTTSAAASYPPQLLLSTATHVDAMKRSNYAAPSYRSPVGFAVMMPTLSNSKRDSGVIGHGEIAFSGRMTSSPTQFISCRNGGGRRQSPWPPRQSATAVTQMRATAGKGKAAKSTKKKGNIIAVRIICLYLVQRPSEQARFIL